MRVDRDRKAFGQLEDSALNPLATVLEVLPGGAIEAAEKGAPDATTHAMENAGLLVTDDFASWVGHV